MVYKTIGKGEDPFKDIWDRWGFQNQPMEERPEGSLIERQTRTVELLKKLNAWRGGEMWLWPVRRLEEYADAMRERADINRGKAVA